MQGGRWVEKVGYGLCEGQEKEKNKRLKSECSFFTLLLSGINLQADGADAATAVLINRLRSKSSGPIWQIYIKCFHKQRCC